ncbi:MAG: hypothetical protein M3P46_04980 [Actinomycetota bacterium]|nr:hypothetical protein [Actinomycetota bacterium]
MTGALGTLTTVLVVTALVVGVLAALTAAVGWEPGRPLLQALVGLQFGLLAQLALVLVRVSGGDRPAEPVAFGGYVVLSLVLLPAGLALSAQERSRWGSLVLAVASLTVAVVELRLRATWTGV